MAKKIIIKICVGIFFAILLILPLVMMFNLSKQEISKYEVNTNYSFKEAAYGEIKRVTRQDLKLYYNFSGTVTSNSYKYIRFPESESAEVTTDDR